MGFVTRQRVSAFAVDNHMGNAVGRVVIEREGELIVIVKRQAHGVEAGTKVGRGGRHAHMDAIADWIHGSILWSGAPLSLTTFDSSPQRVEPRLHA